jgi:hypothetical protein
MVLHHNYLRAGNFLLIFICNFHVLNHFLLIYICNFHVLNHFFLIYMCKLHWYRLRAGLQHMGPTQ